VGVLLLIAEVNKSTKFSRSISIIRIVENTALCPSLYGWRTEFSRAKFFLRAPENLIKVMEKIFFIIPIVLTATAWLYFLTTLAPVVSMEKEVSFLCLSSLFSL